jgi:type III secretion protein R
LGLLRNALGVQQVPPNMVLNSLAIILSIYVMGPIVTDVTTAFEKNSSGSLKIDTIVSSFSVAKEPLKAFLQKHSSERDRAFFLKSAAVIWPPEKAAELKETDLMVLVPAFTVTELTEAFTIGFILYLVFIVVDMVVANILLAMGMSMLSPNIISVPFKLLLFVMLDGWARLVQGLILSYK